MSSTIIWVKSYNAVDRELGADARVPCGAEAECAGGEFAGVGLIQMSPPEFGGAATRCTARSSLEDQQDGLPTTYSGSLAN